MGDIRYVFRFRDLIAKTLEEHLKIIDAYHSCWWGWWKRPSEGWHETAWDDLGRTASPEQPLEIGLFHSGRGEVFCGRVIGIIPPDTAENGLVSVPAGEAHLVPEYYRRSPFSRAWLRLSSIETRPASFFGEYSYRSVPQLPDYSDEVLSWLSGKVIVDPQELRSMDTTIWDVRKRESGDVAEKILFTIRSVGKPISAEPIAARSNRILHLTDPHFALGDKREVHGWRLESEKGRGEPTLAEALNEALRDKPVGLVIVTGDFTFTGSEQEYREAETSLRRLCGLWDLDTDRIVAMPGNHDIRWTKSEAYDEKAKVEVAPAEATRNYQDFYRRLFGHSPDPLLAMGRRFVLPCGLVVEVCAVNSSSLEQGKDFLAGMGRVQDHAVARVANELRWLEGPKPGLSLRLLALHHHLALTENQESPADYYRGFGIAIDAPRIQRLAARRGVHLVLHGHKHRTFVWRSGVYELPEHAQISWRLGDLAIVGGGSAGSRESEAHRNYFNLFEVSGKEMTLEMYRAEPGGSFGLMQSWRAPLSIAPEAGRLVLGDWESL